jgi:hypothetical protein
MQRVGRLRRPLATGLLLLLLAGGLLAALRPPPASWPGGAAAAELPRCSWDRHAPAAGAPRGWERATRALNASGIPYFLTHGGLLGAYRHGAIIPHDGDLDIVLPVWLAGELLAEVAGCGPAEPPGERVCGRDRDAWVPLARAWMERRLRLHGVRHAVRPREWGGFRLAIAGTIEVDLIVSLYDSIVLEDGPRCRCTFGTGWAVCNEGAARVLRRIYGPDFMTPRG